MNADQIGSLQPALATLLKRFRPFFVRRTTFDHWHRYLAGLMADLKRKSIEPIALAAGVLVRTWQEFLAFFVWDEERVGTRLQHLVVAEHGCDQAIGVLDASSHHKQGAKTPGVQRQWRSLLVVGLVALTCTCSCRKKSDTQEKADKPTQSTQLNESRARQIDSLRSLPYVGSSDEPTDPNLNGLVKLYEGRWSPGYTLYNGRNYCAAELLDLKGEVFHVWQVKGRHWDACKLTPNGDLLVVGSDLVTTREAPVVDEARYLMCLSWDRQLRWKRKMFAHHDVDVTPGDRIVAVTFKNKRVPELGRDDARVDYLTMLSADGELIAEKSLYEAFHSNPDEFTFQPVGARSTGPEKRLDPFHTNSVEWMYHEHLYDRHPIYAPTNVLVCTRHQDVVAIINWNTNKLIWAWGPGEIQGPHDAQVLANGNILLFDNGLWRKWSRVIELDPLTKRIVWEYRASNPTDFYTRSGGGCQRLPNGNTLITNSDQGHGFEVTPDGEIVWEFYNPKFTTLGKRVSCARMKRYEPGFIKAIQKQH